MLTIRLSRIGKKNKPMYRLIISEKARDPYGRALEILGSYNPYTKELQSKHGRIKHWLSQGAKMSPTVNNLLVEKSIIKGKKIKASRMKKKKKEQAKQKIKSEKQEEKTEKIKAEQIEKETINKEKSHPEKKITKEKKPKKETKDEAKKE